ncbi:MAG: hypothetical protein JOZ42_06760 [Acetobacteraceae bacterium]|nr:hypothetical protein [Acetobacteraceae bacterium]
MKVTIEIDCTPEEARTFFGQPDLKPMQDKVMARFEKQMLDSVAAMSPEAILKMWSAFLPQNADQFREAFGRFFGRPFAASKPDDRK